MSNFRDLRQLVQQLESCGKLYRFKEPINKDTEIGAIFRVQMRGVPENKRKALLFENVFGSTHGRYDMSVLSGIYGASNDILAIALGCENYVQMLDKWHHGLAHPIAPIMTNDGPVHEEVHTGEDLKNLGLDEIPVPVEEPGFSGILRTGLPMITRDPVTAVRNVGTYNAFFRARDRMVAAIGTVHDAMRYHWRAARARNEGMPLAILIGCTPEIMLVGSADIPYGADELAVAGGLAGAPVELVRCKTIPLEVPAYAECVIEGVVSTEIAEPRLPFGEYPGYLNVDYNVRPIFQVTAITHRKNAWFTPVTVGFPPSDTNLVWGFTHAAQLYHVLKYEKNLPVAEVQFPQLGGGSDFCLLRVNPDVSQNDVQKIIEELERSGPAKYMIIVDHDVSLADPELLIWAMSFRTRPREDLKIVAGGLGGLDPSAAVTGSGKGKMESAGSRDQYSRVIINATRKYPYPPLALPRKEFMDKALQIWERHPDLPAPELREPWFGYELGFWTDEMQKFADMIVAGQYLKVGEEMAKRQRPITEDMFGRRSH
jgi:4-hydroxy-3-polyprenylbenzoate decarboxylase